MADFPEFMFRKENMIPVVFRALNDYVKNKMGLSL